MKIAVIGAGAAGCMAAIAAARQGADVTVFDGNEKIGKKIYITGKGRCNFTNDADRETFLSNVVHNPKFLYKALSTFGSDEVTAFFEENGVLSKVERGGRVFPRSDKSSDIIAALSRAMRESNVSVRLQCPINGLVMENNTVMGVRFGEETDLFDRVIVATGGLSYPTTGSTGDGYGWAKKSGHKIVPLRGALVPFKLKNPPPCEGLSLKNVSLSVQRGERVLATQFGEMLFTKDGISGPIVLTLSSVLSDCNLSDCTACIDLKPALSIEQLDARVQRDFAKYTNCKFGNALDDLLPRSLIPVVIERSKISSDKKVHQITAQERGALIAIFKNLCYPIKGTEPVEHAIITAGGVDVKEINPATMASKVVKNLFFAGEILDLDAFTGGFNLQIAFSTGYLAGKNAAL